MINWNKSEKAKESKNKWLNNGGREMQSERRCAGTDYYKRKLEYRHATFIDAKKRYEKWTIEDEIKLIDMFESGLPASKIAPILNRSLQGIERKLDKLQVRRSSS